MRENCLFFPPNSFRNKKENPGNHGVDIIVENNWQQILLLQHVRAKPQYGRFAGHWNILTETGHLREKPYETIWRAVTEELGVTNQDFRFASNSILKSTPEYKLWMNFSCYCCTLRYLGPCEDPNTLFSSHDEEIAAYAWVYEDELLNYDIEESAYCLIAH